MQDHPRSAADRVPLWSFHHDRVRWHRAQRNRFCRLSFRQYSCCRHGLDPSRFHRHPWWSRRCCPDSYRCLGPRRSFDPRRCPCRHPCPHPRLVPFHLAWWHPAPCRPCPIAVQVMDRSEHSPHVVPPRRARDFQNRCASVDRVASPYHQSVPSQSASLVLRDLLPILEPEYGRPHAHGAIHKWMNTPVQGLVEGALYQRVNRQEVATSAKVDRRPFRAWCVLAECPA